MSWTTLLLFLLFSYNSQSQSIKDTTADGNKDSIIQKSNNSSPSINKTTPSSSGKQYEITGEKKDETVYPVNNKTRLREEKEEDRQAN